MTAEEIRNTPDSALAAELDSEATPYVIRDCFWMLREIAAQLAELNQHLRQSAAAEQLGDSNE